MFDPFDQVRMRTQQLLASAARIREERALQIAASAQPAPSVTEAVEAESQVTREPALECAPECLPQAPGTTRTRAA